MASHDLRGLHRLFIDSVSDEANNPGAESEGHNDKTNDLVGSR